MASDKLPTRASSSPDIAEPVDARRPIRFGLPPYPSTVIRPPDHEHARPCPACGTIDCPSPEHKLIDYSFEWDPNDPVVLIVEDCYVEHAPWRSETPSMVLAFAAGTHARRSQADDAGAVYASLAPPLETK